MSNREQARQVLAGQQILQQIQAQESRASARDEERFYAHYAFGTSIRPHEDTRIACDGRNGYRGHFCLACNGQGIDIVSLWERRALGITRRCTGVVVDKNAAST